MPRDELNQKIKNIYSTCLAFSMGTLPVIGPPRNKALPFVKTGDTLYVFCLPKTVFKRQLGPTTQPSNYTMINFIHSILFYSIPLCPIVFLCSFLLFSVLRCPFYSITQYLLAKLMSNIYK